MLTTTRRPILSLPAKAAGSRLDVMNFLNEVAGDYPQAISFASGRPAEAFFGVQEYAQRIPEFVRHLAHELGIGFDDAFNKLAQYGRTNGIIHPLIARQVALDEGLPCEPAQVLVTAGCQEAMELCVKALCREPDDVVLTRSPTYIGITGVADLHRIGLVHFRCDEGEPVPQALAGAVEQALRQGKRPRALYLVPDFDNPTGTVIDRADRENILALCAAHRIVVLEDNPYGMFRYEGEAVPKMAALDAFGCVVYLGTYAKTLCPALRVGFAVVPPTLFGDGEAAQSLMSALSQAKSFATVNTSQITQAVVGGVLLAEQGSLARRIAGAVSFYRGNRDAMLQALQEAFGDCPGVRWNRPLGGFFLVVSLPFVFGRAEAQQCARDHGVLTMPLSFFALDHAHDRAVRLAFSNADPASIREGVARLREFVRPRTATADAAR